MDSGELAKLPRALRTIAGAARVSGEEVLRGFAGVILKTCVARTKVAKPEQADFRARYRAAKRAFGNLAGNDKNPYGISVNTGMRGGIKGLVWFRTRNKKFHDVGIIRDTGRIGTIRNRHYRTHDWSRMLAGMEAYADSLALFLPYAKRSVALARQSWVQIADSLGIRLEDAKGGGPLSVAALVKARAAIASNGQAYINGLSRQERDQRGLMLTLINRYPHKPSMGLDATLRGALIGQVRYFERNWRLGVFGSIAQTARAYPFLTVTAA